MLDLREMKLLVETLKKFSETNPNLAEEDLIKNIKLAYFHSGKDMYQEVNSSADITITDASFLIDQANYSSRTFCASSPLFNGCIQIEQ